MRTKDPSDLFGRLIDARGGDAAKARKPDGVGKNRARTGFGDDRVRHLRSPPQIVLSLQ
jgi:hypothetical protein